MAPELIAAAVFVFGTLVGSFLNVCILRIPARQSIVRPPSSCPTCKSPIAFYDNIPLLSYLILRGGCRSCAALVVISFIDLDVQIIPDAISLPGIVIGLLVSFLPAARVDHLSLPPSPLDSFLG